MIIAIYRKRLALKSILVRLMLRQTYTKILIQTYRKILIFHKIAPRITIFNLKYRDQSSLKILKVHLILQWKVNKRKQKALMFRFKYQINNWKLSLVKKKILNQINKITKLYHFQWYLNNLKQSNLWIPSLFLNLSLLSRS